MIAQNHAPLQAGQIGRADASTSAHVLMMANEIVTLMTREKTNDTNLDKQPSGSTSLLPLLLHLMVLYKLRNPFLTMYCVLQKE